MTVREERDVTLHLARLRDYAACAARYVFYIFTIGRAVAKDDPAGAVSLNVCRGPALIGTVVPLGEIGLHDRLAPKSSQFAGAAGACERAGPDRREPVS